MLAGRIICNFPNRDIVKLNVTSHDFALNEKIISSLGLIVNELLTNIMKYAFVGKDSGDIYISLLKKNDRVFLTIDDNGNGMPNDTCLLYTSPSPRDRTRSRMPSSA